MGVVDDDGVGSHQALVADRRRRSRLDGLHWHLGPHPYADAVPSRRVLVTNWSLVNRAGSELYVRDLTIGLLRRGHEPMVWSPVLGPMADEIRRAGVRVIEDLAAPIPNPDLIHAQHHDESVAAMARFPDRPGLFVQHGAVPWQEEAPLHPRLLRYVGVDELCRQRLLGSGVDPSIVTVVPNSVDLQRFAPREPLPARPTRALVLSNAAREDTFLPAVRGACARAGLALDVRGLGVGAPVQHPEHELPRYDLVFAKARAALEAVAVGCAVVVLDEVGLAGMVTSADLPEWLRWNLGRNLLTRPLEVDLIVDEIERYDPADAGRCTTYVRTHRGLDGMIDSLLQEYERVMATWGEAPAPDHRAELEALASQLSTIGPLRAKVDESAWYAGHNERLETALGDARRGLDAVRAEADAVRAERDALHNRRAVRWVDAVAARLSARDR